MVAMVSGVAHPPSLAKRICRAALSVGMVGSASPIPFASIVVFRSLGQRITEADQRKLCEFFKPSSRSIDPIVREVLISQETAHPYPGALERIQILQQTLGKL